MAGPPLPGTSAFDLFDHGGIEADTAVEKEVAPLDRSETDAIDVAGIESFEEHGDGVDAVVREAEDPAKTLVEPPGRVARAVSVPARPLAASLSVPSPPSTTTRS